MVAIASPIAASRSSRRLRNACATSTNSTVEPTMKPAGRISSTQAARPAATSNSGVNRKPSAGAVRQLPGERLDEQHEADRAEARRHRQRRGARTDPAVAGRRADVEGAGGDEHREGEDADGDDGLSGQAQADHAPQLHAT